MVGIEIDTKSLERQVRGLHASIQKQVPFALMLALNETAKDIEKSGRRHVRKQFTVRNSWLEKGPKALKVHQRAKKTKLEAIIGMRGAYHMELHEGGGTKRAHNKHGTVFIPTKNVKRTKAGLVRKADKPGQLLAGKTTKKGTQTQVGFIRGDTLYVRDPRKNRGPKGGIGRYPITAMYVIKPQARIKDDLDFIEDAQAVASRTFEGHFNKAFQQALATMKT